MKHFTLTLVLAVLSVCVSTASLGNDVTTHTAPDGTTVVVYRDLYGVPHIRASTETGLFYGQGYAVAEDRLFQMETFRRAALGRLSEAGLGSRTTDRQIRATTYTESERAAQFLRLAPEVQNMIAAYVSGINAHIAFVMEDLVARRPAEFFAPSLAFSMEDPRPWTNDDVVAVAQFFMRRFGQYGGEELTRLVELNTFGLAWFEENRPINDPAAPTTIPGSSLAKVSATTHVSGAPSEMWVDPAVVEELTRQAAEAESELAAIHIPPKLGSFAVVVAQSKSESGNVLMLGAPQLSPPALGQTNITHEVELDAATLHVAGMAIAGIPGVIIGHTEQHAWSLTSGNSDNTDTFIEILNPAGTAYLFEGAYHPFEVIPEPDLEFARVRTVHGPVIMLDAANGRAFSWQLTFWDRELEMVEAFYRAWKAADLTAFEEVLRVVPMNFNVVYAGRDQRIKYFHVGALLRNTQTREGHDPRLPRLGDGSQEWGDDPFLAFEELPSAGEDLQSYYVNWNNKPAPSWNNGDNIPWSLVFRHERTIRVQRIEDFIAPIPSVTFEDLKAVPREIADRGTYQQVVEFTPTFIRNENLVAPGQSGFISLATGPSPHVADQWALHENWAFKNMAFNEPVQLWPPDQMLSAVDVTNYIHYGSPEDAVVDRVWADEPNGPDAASIHFQDCTTVLLRADRDGAGNGRVYTVHAAAPDAVGNPGTAALFQVYVPKSASPEHAFAPDDGPRLVETNPCLEEHSAPTHDVRSSAPSLDQNQPNPFNPSTLIHYELPESGHVTIAVYNVLGQEVRRVYDGFQSAGRHAVSFDGSGLSTGIYLYSLRTSGSVLTRSMVLQK